MNRADHLAWAKTRAFEHIDLGNPINALDSFTSDLSKHDYLKTHSGIELTFMLQVNGHLTDLNEVRRHIESFN